MVLKKDIKKLLDKVTKEFLYRGNGYNDLEWFEEDYNFDCEDDQGNYWEQEVNCWTCEHSDAMYRIPLPFIELLKKEAQKELLEEIRENFIPINMHKDFDNWVKREVSNK